MLVKVAMVVGVKLQDATYDKKDYGRSAGPPGGCNAHCEARDDKEDTSDCIADN